MTLSTADRKLATKWFVKNAIKEPGKTATVDVLMAFQAVGETDDWIDASPAEDPAPSRGASFKAAIHSAFDTSVDAVQLATLFAAVTLARAGLLPGQ